MHVYHFRPLEPGPLPAVLTIGTFDGVHLGHQALIQRVVAEAKALKVASALLTFDPHPQTVLRTAPMPLLTSAAMRLRLFERHGLDGVYFVPFTPELARKSALDFFNEYLLRSFNLRKLVIGYDFGFGRGREGSASTLEELSAAHGFGFEVFPPVTVEGAPVSSTRIRSALHGADFALAERLLGRPYSVLEPVVRGDQRGRQLGFPTANQTPQAPLPLAHGVYASRALVGEASYPAVSNYGVRPTVGGTVPVLETHLFGADLDLYGQTIEVMPVARLRGEQKFPSLDALREQIARDSEAARQVLGLGG